MGKRTKRIRQALAGDVLLTEVAQEAATAALAEARSGSGPTDPDEMLWTRLGGYDTRRDLPQATREKSAEAAFEMWQSNPLAHRIVELNRDFVVGDGLTAGSRHPEIAEILDDFWSDPVNDMELRSSDFCLELGLYGELFPEVFVGEVAGTVQLGYIDPAQVIGTIPMERNPLIIDELRVKRGRAVVKGQPVPVVRWRQDAGDATKVDLSGDAFFWRVNSVSNATRGYSDLLHISDWLDAYNSLLWEMLERAALMRTFIWDVTLKGANQQTVDEWIRKHGKPPKSGTVRAHDENATWEAVSPELGSFEAKAEAQLILEHIAGGAGDPKTWLSAAEDVNRATALEMASPTVRRLQQRQKYYLACVRRLLEFVVVKAAASKRIGVNSEGMIQDVDENGDPKKDDEGNEVLVKPQSLIDLRAPEISPKDMQSAGNLLVQVVQALSAAKAEGWVGDDSAVEVFAGILQQVGYDLDTERQDDNEDDQVEDPNAEPVAAPIAYPEVPAEIQQQASEAVARFGK